MTQEQPSITVSRRALLRGALGVVGVVSVGIAARHLLRTDFDVTELRERLPGVDLILAKWEGREPSADTPTEAEFSEAEVLALRRRLADIEFVLLGGKPGSTTPEQHELILRWLDALHIYATIRIASGISPWATDLYEGSTEFINENRAQWDDGLTEIVQQQQADEQKEEEGD